MGGEGKEKADQIRHHPVVLHPQNECRAQPRKWYWTVGITLLAALLCLRSVSSINFLQECHDRRERRAEGIPLSASSLTTQDLQFDWSTLVPSSDLHYTPCFRKFYCARLEVPLNWNSTGNDKFVLAIIKKPALVDVTHPKYGGVILFNPGGPAASGVDFIRRYGGSLDWIFNYGDKHYDLLAWDPRGTGDTTPAIEGLTNLARHDYDQKLLDLADVSKYDEVFNRLYQMKGIYGKFVSSSLLDPNKDHPVQFLGTTNVVRDMLEIIEKHGKWRESAAEKVLQIHGKSLSQTQIQTIRQSTAYRKDAEMLQFWGGSYGTVLGQTFASMYPERVGRLAIDGVVNVTDWFGGELKNMLSGARATTTNFTTECMNAGPTRCQFATASDTHEMLTHKWHDLFSQLSMYPIIDVVKSNPVYITNWMVRGALFYGWFTGWFGYHAAGDIMHNLELQNSSFFSSPDPDMCRDTSLTAFDTTIATIGIFCSDAEKRYSRDEYRQYVESALKESSEWGPFFALGNPACQHWPRVQDSPSWRYAGPFAAKKTANPILVLSQTIDPVTPLINAQDAATKFSAQLVEAQGLGHTSFGYPSVCAMKELKQYFDTGKVSRNHTFCPASVKPFQTVDEVVEQMEDMAISDRYILASALRIASDWPPGSPAIQVVKNKLCLPGVNSGDWWGDRESTASTAPLILAQYS